MDIVDVFDDYIALKENSAIYNYLAERDIDWKHYAKGDDYENFLKSLLKKYGLIEYDDEEMMDTEERILKHMEAISWD